MQETALSLLYVVQARRFLRDTRLAQASLGLDTSRRDDKKGRSGPASASLSGTGNRALLWQLLHTNLLVIALDIALLGIQYADLFYLQGAFKPCVYGIKLRVEFVVLNRLIKSVRKSRRGETLEGYYRGGRWGGGVGGIGAGGGGGAASGSAGAATLVGASSGSGGGGDHPHAPRNWWSRIKDSTVGDEVDEEDAVGGGGGYPNHGVELQRWGSQTPIVERREDEALSVERGEVGLEHDIRQHIV